MDESPSPIIYPLGVVVWVVVGFLLLASLPADLHSLSVGILLFILPLGMAVLAAFLNLFTREGRPMAMRRTARTLVFACLFPFVAWGEWEAKHRKPRE